MRDLRQFDGHACLECLLRKLAFFSSFLFFNPSLFVGRVLGTNALSDVSPLLESGWMFDHGGSEHSQK